MASWKEEKEEEEEEIGLLFSQISVKLRQEF